MRPPTAEHAAQQSLHDWEGSLSWHAEQPRKPGFAQPAREKIEEHMDLLAKQLHFVVVATDCRSDSCTATVEWPSYAEAVNGFRDAVQTTIGGLNCARGTTLPRPQDGTVPYVSTFLFTSCKLVDEAPDPKGV